ncbi:MAG TPA: ATP-binding protein [Pseudobdellovibrionaceae bacterium]|nr:ATP-binding protein [Pseudobdellovibrionaceae bacterium]
MSYLIRRKPRRSIRTILILWVLMFSILPLIFVTVYSMSKFEKAIDREISHRLSSNYRELSFRFEEIHRLMLIRGDRMNKAPDLRNALNSSSRDLIRSWISRNMTIEKNHSIGFFDRSGKLLLSLERDRSDRLNEYSPTREIVYLSPGYFASLKSGQDNAVIEFNGKKHLISLVYIAPILGPNGRVFGYIEQTMVLEQNFVDSIKENMKLEIMMFDGNGDIVLASHGDFYVYEKGHFKKRVGSPDAFFDLPIRGEKYGFSVGTIPWSDTTLTIAMGVDKMDAESALRQINYAFLSVMVTIGIFLIIVVLITSSFVLRPVYKLVEALQTFESEDQAITIPVYSQTEIGLLTESFNEMSQKIWSARADLKKKIFELEQANREIRDTQAKLVHSAKMVSLGQLVAGVAHELNNPISFISGNMIHLQDYTNRLIELIRFAETNPIQLKAKKEELEFDYILQDLPRLIQSCQDGASRTRDIVIGLRNFSRLEEAKLQELDLEKAIESTIQLLQGEIKGRIEIVRQFAKLNPILCYPSQINQVLMNVIANAAQAIEKNGHIWISTIENPNGRDGYVSISVQDDGKGISPDNLDKIFDPFYTTKEVGQGTGLGLSISYGIVHNHGGEISVKSNLGVGTEFTIVLPMRLTNTLRKQESNLEDLK